MTVTLTTKEQIEQVQLETAIAALEEQTARNAERKLLKESKAQDSKGRAKTLADQTLSRRTKQRVCTHLSGGVGMEAARNGQGDGDVYCVIKHRLPSNQVIVRCSRCSKTWYPPLQADYTKDGKFNSEAFNAAHLEYTTALKFKMNGKESGAATYQILVDGVPTNPTTMTHEFIQGAKHNAL